MPRLFVKGSSTAAENAASALSAYPFTMSAWFNPTTSNATGTVVSVANSSSGNVYAAMGVTSASKPFLEVSNSGVGDAIHGTSVVNGQWGHILATATSATDRSVYFNGLSPVQDVTNIAFPTSTRTGIGNFNNGGIQGSFADGVIAHCAIWNVVLNSDEIKALASGVSPLYIRSSSLVSYAPMSGVSSPEVDLKLAGGFTLTNSPAVSTNLPPVSNLHSTLGAKLRPHPFSPGLAR